MPTSARAVEVRTAEIPRTAIEATVTILRLCMNPPEFLWHDQREPSSRAHEVFDDFMRLATWFTVRLPARAKATACKFAYAWDRCLVMLHMSKTSLLVRCMVLCLLIG